jgi:hypothetical protein
MSELTLIKAPEVTFVTPANRSIRGEQVVGITPPQAPTIVEYGYISNGGETEEQIVVDDTMGGHIADFFRQCVSTEPGKRPYHECHTFVWYALGKVKTLGRYESFRIGGVYAADENLLQAGTAYAVADGQGTPNHSLLGMDGSDRSLSVLGENSSLLAVFSSEQLLRFYGGVAMQHILPIPTEPKRAV